MDPNRANEVRKKCSCPKRSVYGQLWGQRLLSVDPWFRPIPMCVFEKSCGPRLSSLGGGMDPSESTEFHSKFFYPNSSVYGQLWGPQL